MRIRDISQEQRPRERMARGEALSEAELLAIILQKGTREENVIDMSHRLISAYSLEKLSSCSLVELQAIKGIGPAKAMQIKAVFELSKRVKYQNNGKVIKTAKDVYDYCWPKMQHLDREQFRVLLLDSKNKVIKDEVVSVGTLNVSIIHPREVFKTAIKESANAIILVHNHPSGDVRPSKEDEEITERLMEAGETLNIKVLDHVVVGNNEWRSCK